MGFIRSAFKALVRVCPLISNFNSLQIKFLRFLGLSLGFSTIVFVFQISGFNPDGTATLFGVSSAQAQSSTNICFCHATGSQDNPFNTICTSNSGQQNGHTGHGDPDFGCQCGDGFCDANDGEDCGTCPQDCGACPACGNMMADPGEECGDGDLQMCPEGETCEGCRCTPPPPECFVDEDCDDGNACTDDLCNGQLRICENTTLNDGTSCDDGDLCNGEETCQMGVCTDGTAVTCDDGRSCSTDTCITESGICNYDVSNCGCDSNGDCDDGNPCTQDLCDVSAGTCTNPPDDAGTCDDGRFCNGTETCVEGSCQSSGDPCTTGGECADECDEANNSCNDPVGATCTDDGNDCTDNRCDGMGACVPVNNTDTCDDMNPCTVGEVCAGGTCGSGTPYDCDDGIECTIDSCSVDPNTGGALCTHDDSGCDCATAEDCDQSNSCVDAVCNDQRQCEYTNNTDPCDDGLFCNGTDVCADGMCTHSGDPCVAGGECADLCDEDSNSCNDPQGTPCTDDDGNDCVDHICNGSGDCVAQNNMDDCSDDNPCTVNDQCSGGDCNPGTGYDCNDFIECTVDSCSTNPDTGGPLCSHDTSGCDCTQDIDCDDGNVCTDDVCNDQNECEYSNNTNACDDGQFCNGTDVCSGGECTHSGDPCANGGECADSCDDELDTCNDMQGTPCTSDGNVCTDNVCNGDGSCVAVNNMADCSDSNSCTVTDVCSEGSCSPGSAFDCDDGIECTIDSCEGSGGEPQCLHDPSGCPCTMDEQCNDNNPCTVNTCNDSYQCETQVLTGETCDDVNPCTENDMCNDGGGCSGSAIDCSDGRTCSVDSCNIETGECVYDLSGCGCDVDADCDDGNECTADSCALESGLCQNSPLSGDIDGDGNVDCEDGHSVPDETGGGVVGGGVFNPQVQGSGEGGGCALNTASGNAVGVNFLIWLAVLGMWIPFRNWGRSA